MTSHVPHSIYRFYKKKQPKLSAIIIIVVAQNRKAMRNERRGRFLGGTNQKHSFTGGVVLMVMMAR